MGARIYNGGSTPLVVSWGDGVVGPGENIIVDNPDLFGVDNPDSPWTRDSEADQALVKSENASADKQQVKQDNSTQED